MKQFLLVFAMLILCLLAFAENSGWAFFTGVQGDYFSVVSVPLEMRDVPIHPDDDYVSLSNQGPILRQSYDTRLFVLLGGQYSIKSSNGIITRFKLSIPIYPEDDLAERNYTNDVGSDHRGYGAALTYCKLCKGGIFTAMGFDGLTPILDFMPEISVEKMYGKKISTEVSAGYFAVSFINGWDRWDAYQCRDGYLLAHCMPVSTNLKFRVGQWQFSGGPILVNVIETSNGKGILRYDNFGWSTRVNVGF